MGSLKASGSTIATAIPSASPEMAESMAPTISLTTDASEPVHCDFVPSKASASSMPYCVGTKKGLVVTWLTKTKLYSGVSGKLPPEPPDPPWLACCASCRHPASNNPADANAPPARNCRRPNLRSPKPPSPDPSSPILYPYLFFARNLSRHALSYQYASVSSVGATPSLVLLPARTTGPCGRLCRHRRSEERV